MLYHIMDFIFKNIILIILIILILIIIKQYKYLKNQSVKINNIFEKTLSNYLDTKIKEAQAIANSVREEYKDIDEVKPEIDRFFITIEKGLTGNINDKVECSNAINKYKLNQKIEIQKYPNLSKLAELGTFTESDMNSVDNGIALARKEYNTLAFQYNEKSSAFPMQYLAKILGLSSHFVIFDAPKSKMYAEKYEVFEEAEPVIDTISILNNGNKDDDIYLDSLNRMNRAEPKNEEQVQQEEAPNTEENVEISQEETSEN